MVRFLGRSVVHTVPVFFKASGTLKSVIILEITHTDVYTNEYLIHFVQI
jgi:hypothetical protein